MMLTLSEGSQLQSDLTNGLPRQIHTQSRLVIARSWAVGMGLRCGEHCFGATKGLVMKHCEIKLL